MKCVSHGKLNRIYSNDDEKLIKHKKPHNYGSTTIHFVAQHFSKRKNQKRRVVNAGLMSAFTCIEWTLEMEYRIPENESDSHRSVFHLKSQMNKLVNIFFFPSFYGWIRQLCVVRCEICPNLNAQVPLKMERIKEYYRKLNKRLSSTYYRSSLHSNEPKTSFTHFI